MYNGFLIVRIIYMVSHTSIIVTGSIAYDDIMVFPGHFKDHFHPEKLHQINISFAVDSLIKHIGGTGTNISYNVRRYTDKKTYLIGAMGQDHETITRFCEKNNIDYSGSYIDAELYCSTGKVITDISDNQIWGFYYGAAAKGNLIDFAPYTKGAFGIISANHSNAFLHAQQYFIKHSIPYLYDPGMSLTWISDEDLKVGIEHAQILVGNDYEIAQMTRRLKTSVADFVTKGVAVITTLGAEGVKYEDGNQTYEVSGFNVKKIVDPTGAGDAWRGGFVAARVEGKEILESLQIANALASFAVEHAGTANHLPSKKEIEARAKELTVKR
ncbi:carbohydrate kinase family protein [soil metagenome]